MPNETDSDAVAKGDSALRLLVREKDSAGPHHRLSFQIASEFRTSESGIIQGNPVDLLREYLAGLEKARIDSPQQEETVRRKGLSMGLALARQLVPGPIQEWLCGQRGKDRSLTINSDETWVPWELLALPCPDSGDPLVLGHEFALCRQFEDHQPIRAISMNRLAYVVTGAGDLVYSEAEIEAIKKYFKKSNKITARLTEVQDGLREALHDAWHVISHGVARTKSADLWGLALDGGDKLTSSDLELTRSALAAKRPFIFLNACHGGRGGRRLIDAGGLAHAFVEAGASAVIAATFAVDDEPAAAFAPCVYTGLALGLPLGKAVQRARGAIRDHFPGNPTHLAYLVYGDPNARVVTVSTDAPAKERSTSKTPRSPSIAVPPFYGSTTSRRQLRRPKHRKVRFQRWCRVGAIVTVIVGAFLAIWVGHLFFTEADPTSVELRSPGRADSQGAGATPETSGRNADSTHDPNHDPGRDPSRDQSRDQSRKEHSTETSPSPGFESTSSEVDPESSGDPSDEEKPLVSEETLVPDEEFSPRGESMGTAPERRKRPVNGSANVEPIAGDFATEDPAREQNAKLETPGEIESRPSAAQEHFREEITVADDASVYSLPARSSVAVDFQSFGQTRFVKLTIAPEGGSVIDRVFYRQGGQPIPFETPSGRWIVQVLSVNYGNQTLTLQLSREATP